MIKDWTLMGIVNVTPDSFSDGGQFLAANAAIAHGKRLIEEGADIIDIGGESTRPGAAPVSVAEEIDRILPVIEGLKGQGALISVDTRRADTMQAVLQVGIDIINDISALTYDPKALDFVAGAQCRVCLMHMQGTPQTMQVNPSYQDVVAEIRDYLAGRVAACVEAGIDKERIMIDPGIGFGKRLEDNLKLLNNLAALNDIGAELMLGVSRKRFIEHISQGAATDQRLPGSLAAVIAAYHQGVRVFRVHDVKETAQALAVTSAISHG